MLRVYRCLLLWLLLPALPAFAAGLVGTPEQLNRQGVEFYQQGHPELALEPLKQAVQASPYQATIRSNLIAAYLAAGRAAIETHRYRQAAELLLEAREFDNGEPQLWLYRAHALIQLHEYAAAEIDLQEVLALVTGEQRLPVLKLLGKVYDQTGRLAETIEVWRQALELAPADQELILALQRAERAYPFEHDLDRQLGGQFLLHFDAEADADLGAEILATLQDAYADIGSRFGSYPDEQISVLVYTRRDFSLVTASPGWAGGAYDGKIRLPLGGQRKLTPAVRGLLYHEYTHVVIRHLTNGNCPIWLNEGLAEAVSREQFDHPYQVLPTALQENRLYAFAQLSGSLSNLAGDQAILVYEQSLSFVRFLIDRYGWYSLVDLLHALGAGQETGRALAEAFNTQDLDLHWLEEQWREQLAAGTL